MDPARIKYCEDITKTKYESNDKRILSTKYSKLTIEEKNKCCDMKMDLIAEDLQNEEEACALFDQLDNVERYSDMLRLIIQYPELMSAYYEVMSQVSKYNLDQKWDGDLEKLIYVTKNDWLYDLISVVQEKHEMRRIFNLLQSKMKKKYGIDITKEDAMKYLA